MISPLTQWKLDNYYYQLDQRTKEVVTQIVRVPTSRKDWEHVYEPIKETSLVGNDEGIEQFEQNWEMEYQTKRLISLMKGILTKKQFYIIQFYYGIGIEESMTMPQIADYFETTKQSVDQTIKKGIKRLQGKIDPSILFYR